MLFELKLKTAKKPSFLFTLSPYRKGNLKSGIVL